MELMCHPLYGNVLLLLPGDNKAGDMTSVFKYGCLGVQEYCCDLQSPIVMKPVTVLSDLLTYM
jgi:hypothetical protein